MSSHSPQRIVSLQPSVTVILRELGRLDLLVACTRYCKDVCPEVLDRNIALVHDSWTADCSQITAAKPDLVIASVPYQEQSVIEILKSGVRFLGFAPRTLSDIYTDIAMIAGLVGEDDAGNRIIREMEDEIADVRRKTRHLKRPRVFCEEWGKPIISSQPWVAELVEAAGGEFLTIPGVQTSAAAVADLRPEVIVAAWCGAGDRVPLEKIIEDRKWQQTPAALTDSVFCVRDEFLNTPAPTLLHGLRALAAALHPEVFLLPDGIRSIKSSSETLRPDLV